MVLVFWVIVIALTGSLAGKLMGAEKNDASAYLPASAESTQELNLQSKFIAKNLNPAVVVYFRPSGLTPTDLRKAAADARLFAALPAVHGRVAGPIPSAITRRCRRSSDPASATTPTSRGSSTTCAPRPPAAIPGSPCTSPGPPPAPPTQ